MRVKGIRFEQVLMAAMLLAALCWNLANASEIKQLRVDAGATGTRAEVHLDRPGAYKVIELHNPERLVVDFPGSRLGRSLGLPTPTGAIRAVRTGQPEAGTVRVVFDLATSTRPLPPRIEDGAGAVRSEERHTCHRDNGMQRDRRHIVLGPVVDDRQLLHVEDMGRARCRETS